MPKVSKAGKFRQTAALLASASDGSSDKKTESKKTDNLSRGQRKRQAKREQYLQREKMVLSSLSLKRKQEQTKRIDGLDSLKEALLETQTEQTTASSPTQKSKKLHIPFSLKSNKSRQTLVAKETTQLKLVMEHPSFQADPFATMRLHLQNTIANDPEKKQQQQKERIRERKDKQEAKKAFKKEQGIKRKRKKFKATRSKAR